MPQYELSIHARPSIIAFTQPTGTANTLCIALKDTDFTDDVNINAPQVNTQVHRVVIETSNSGICTCLACLCSEKSKDQNLKSERDMFSHFRF